MATTYVTAPDGQDVADFLGRGNDNDLVTLAGENVGVITAMIRGYTRGTGFDDQGKVAEDLAAVICTATARMASNPENIRNESIGSMNRARTIFNGWTLPETMILNRYRRRAR